MNHNIEQNVFTFSAVLIVRKHEWKEIKLIDGLIGFRLNVISIYDTFNTWRVFNYE